MRERAAQRFGTYLRNNSNLHGKLRGKGKSLHVSYVSRSYSSDHAAQDEPERTNGRFLPRTAA